MNFLLPPLRPPGALPEKSFSKLCVHCGQCVTSCPYHSIYLKGGFGKDRLTPVIDPQAIPCYLCLKCQAACPTGALDAKITELEQVHMGQAYIGTDRCHNYVTGIMCMTCYDRCPLRGKAVILDLGLNPAMTTQCVGCGICAYVCPVDAITIVPESSQLVPPLSADLKTVKS
ncbi:MAG: 4Fe-4S dicluster domain-containing protein [Desulfovibrionaceae bacterium]|nr:4Fe-4S dicluster domain-containing protein [Desulfovibrionaceae bacterium]